MTSRERMAATLNHKQPDRIPIDFCSTMVTGIAAGTIYNLRKKLGLEEKAIKIIEPYQMLGEIDQDIKDFLGVDTACIFPNYNMFGFKNAQWKRWTMFDGTPVLVPKDFNTLPNEKGDILMYPKGNKNASASAVMPYEGYYFDALRRQDPIDESKLDVQDNLEEFCILSDENAKYYETEVGKLYSETGYAIVTGLGGTALGDIAMVPGLDLEHPKGIRDVEEWYVSTMIRRDYIKEVFDKQTDIALKNLEILFQAVGNKVMVITLCGNDFGTQIAPFCSAEVFNDLYLPFYKKMTDWIHQNTSWKVFKHSCGAIEPLMGCFINAGIDIINPVQCAAKGMEPQALKDKYGDRIIFWGGGVDTQTVLPFGTPEEVKEQVRERMHILGKNGGFVFATVHNVQMKTPVENLIAMVETIKEKD